MSSSYGSRTDEKSAVEQKRRVTPAATVLALLWGKLIGDVPSATAILDRFLHHAQVVPMKGRSYRLKDSACKGDKENV